MRLHGAFGRRLRVRRTGCW